MLQQNKITSAISTFFSGLIEGKPEPEGKSTKLLNLTDYKSKPLVKNLGSWIESEGYLLFDSFLIPQPVGFRSELGYRAYAEKMMVFAESLGRIESLFDVAIKQVSVLLHDPSKVQSSSLRIPKLTRLDNGMVAKDMLTPLTSFFDPKSTASTAPFTTLFNSAHDLNLTALTIESLTEKASIATVERFNKKIETLAEYLNLLNDQIVENTDRQRKDVMAMIRDNIIIPLSEWAECLSIFVYYVNVLYVEFTNVEEHIKSKM